MTAAGYFGPNSVAWRLHSDPVMLVGGMRALLVQALEPRAMAAVDQFGKFREDPWGRLERTSNFVLATTFGDTVAADAAAATVRNVHAHIKGVDPHTGREFAANDPDLLLWIHAVEVESFVVAYREPHGATRFRFSGGRASSVRMLWRRSASLISTTRMSSAMARNILRMLSAQIVCLTAGRSTAPFSPFSLNQGTRDSLVTPSTKRETSAPNRASSSVIGTLQSSATSCSNAATSVDASS